jgi:hypothetical protein
MCLLLNFLTKQQPSALILITFEFAIMAVIAMTTLTKYALAVIDTQIEGIWHAKLSYEFALDFVSEVSIQYPCMQKALQKALHTVPVHADSTAYSVVKYTNRVCLYKPASLSITSSVQYIACTIVSYSIQWLLSFSVVVFLTPR